MSYPRPTLFDLIDRARSELGPHMLRRNIEDGLARVLGAVAHGLHGHVAWAGRQMLPDRAGPAQVARWGRMYGLRREIGQKATGWVRFTASGVISLPTGSRVRDGAGHLYVTTATTGPYSNAVYVPVEAVNVGAAQNLAEGAPVFLVDGVPGVNTAGVVGSNPYNGTTPSEFSGGLDEESEPDFRERLIDRMRRQPRGGAPGDYAALAREGGASWAWEAVERDAPGSVDVFVMKYDPADPVNPTLPDADELEAIRAYVLEHSPITVAVNVTVPGATLVVVEVDAHFTPDQLHNQAALEAAVEDELRALFFRELQEGGTIPLSRIREAISLAGVSHTLVAPATAPTAIPGNVLALSAVNFV